MQPEPQAKKIRFCVPAAEWPSERPGGPGRRDLRKIHLKPMLKTAFEFSSNAAMSSLPPYCDGVKSGICNECHVVAVLVQFIQRRWHWLRSSI
jgi:hypothetical protein